MKYMKRDGLITFWILLLTIIGMVDTAYLSWSKYTHTDVKCLPGVSDCGTVTSSAYSVLAGIPVAYLGLLSYIVLSVLFILKVNQKISSNNFIYGIFGLSLIGVIFSGYLTYISIAVLQTTCIYCLLSAFCMLCIFLLSLYKLRNMLNN